MEKFQTLLNTCSKNKMEAAFYNYDFNDFAIVALFQCNTTPITDNTIHDLKNGYIKVNLSYKSTF